MLNQGTIRRARSSLIFIFDLAAGLSIFSIVYYLRLDKMPNYLAFDLWLILLTFVATQYLTGTYFREHTESLPALPIRTFFISLVGGVVCIAWLYLLGPHEFNEYFGRGVLPVSTLLFGITSTFIRYAVNRLYHIQERNLELLYVGHSPSFDTFRAELTNHAEVRGVSLVARGFNGHKRHLTDTYESLDLALSTRDWKAIIIDPEYNPSKGEKSALIKARLSGTPILSLADYYERNWHMIPINDIKDDWFLKSQGFSMIGNPVSNRVKRIIDITLATVLLVLSSPLLLICILLIKLTSRGPILFRQTRVGYKGRRFTIYKLRTMCIDAEQNGAQWASENDPRVTKVGRILRRSRLDEIPQCWNVLTGTMSFIGPRPERPEFTSVLTSLIPYYDLRHTVKPGISGWAQVIYPYGASNEDALRKLQYELYYIKHQSLLFDLNIMIRTLFTVFQRAGR